MVVFIDDILIYSKKGKEHAQHREIVLQTLKRHTIYAKLKKCESWLYNLGVFPGTHCFRRRHINSSNKNPRSGRLEEVNHYCRNKKFLWD